LDTRPDGASRNVAPYVQDADRGIAQEVLEPVRGDERVDGHGGMILSRMVGGIPWWVPPPPASLYDNRPGPRRLPAGWSSLEPLRIHDRMKAIRFDQFGEPSEVLKAVDMPDPRPGRGEILVRMIASPINPSDMLTVRGLYGVRP